MIQRKKVNEVFTPRNPKVNVDMYIPRETLEKSLFRSIDGTMHSFLFGESGNGKSWLYKKVFEEKEINFVVANCANASRKDSIVDEIYSVCMGDCSVTKTSYKESKKAGLKLVGTCELAHEGTYEILQEDRLLQAFRKLSSKSKSEKTVIVLDNVETIIANGKLMGELSDIIILLDDERYADFGIKFLVVGLPNQVVEYFSAAKNAASVANRVEEISRVAGLDGGQVRDLVRHGVRQLKIEMTPGQIKSLSKHINNVTLGVPQRVHEYCETLAYNIEDNDWVYSEDLLEKSDHAWLIKGLRECYTVIDSYLNADETIAGRRNQVIYVLGQNSLHQVHTNKVGKALAEEFPATKPESNSGIGQILAHLSKGDTPILKKIPKSSAYVLTDPRYLMCIRLMLFKNEETEQVRKKSFRFN